MQRRPWDEPLDKRREFQRGKARELIIEKYAPLEPRVMQTVLQFLRFEKRFPLELAHRVIDRLASISVATTVLSYPEITAFVNGLPDDFAIACGPCACRLHTAATLGPDGRDLPQRNLELCRSTPLEVDIQIALSAEKFAKTPGYRMISKPELLDLERRCFELGLVSNIYQMLDGESGICHCSAATCAPFMANQALGGRSSVIRRGRLVPSLDSGRCQGTGDCLKVCHFQARRLIERDERQQSEVDLSRCYGCGLCAAVCPEHALAMVPRGRGERE